MTDKPTAVPAAKKTRTRTSKADRFAPLAAKRVTVALKAIRRVGSLSAFSPSPDQTADMVSSLSQELSRVTDILENTKVLPPAEFTFSKAA